MEDGFNVLVNDELKVILSVVIYLLSMNSGNFRKNSPSYGQFSNSMHYAQIGDGERVILVFIGGPGNDIPRGFEFSMYSKPFRGIASEFQIYFLSRKSQLTPDYTTEKMAHDYAEVIRQDFGGKVFAVVGISYGGMILQHFAALYPDLAEKFVILCAAHKVTPEGGALDLKGAELLSKKQTGRAYRLLLDGVFPRGLKRAAMKVFISIFALFPQKHDASSFLKDVLVEAHAELAHDADSHLRNTPVHLVIIGGDQDTYFSLEAFETTYKLVPEATLKIFHGKGHAVFIEDGCIAYLQSYLRGS